MFDVRVQEAPFDVAAAHAALCGLGPDIGAIVTFTGQVRDEPLFLEHYPGMAERAIASVLESARARWPIRGAIIVHRHGPLAVGAPIVLVATAASHRAEAFEAAQYLMDYLKTRAPFWKRGHDGWVEARARDELAEKRWQNP
ncbi:molybdenum cofactor biosynthesis protein MoaE [Thermaurantiacus sp.]